MRTGVVVKCKYPMSKAKSHIVDRLGAIRDIMLFFGPIMLISVHSVKYLLVPDPEHLTRQQQYHNKQELFLPKPSQ